ncbi:2-dehydropantoate 2-reductase [uncultured Shewanella sp.]|uniref:ketopantoate reductase family protein n=1 Tax=uncultured Shewanella sp. TaxID=173975 RepID=UPI00260D408E|nr:2-dehydropantoate 2-reductase [uncultured Shewanella sp.]
MNHIGILGAGAIGQLLHLQLSQPKTHTDSLHLIDRHNTRSQHIAHTTNNGIKAEYEAHFVSAQNPSEKLSNIQLLIVCVKAYQVTNALLPLLDKLQPQCHILLFHNGMGPHLIIEKILQDSYPTLGLSLGTTSQGALKHDKWHIEQTGRGLTQFGHYYGPKMSTKLKQKLLDSLDNIQFCDPILPMLWQKLAVNATINPLTAIEQCKNGQLIADQYYSTIDKLTDEVILVAKHDGIQLEKAPLLKRIFDVISLTKNNYSSMYQDIKHHRKSEIDNINGYLIQQAEKYQIAVPENRYLYRRIKQIESINND